MRDAAVPCGVQCGHRDAGVTRGDQENLGARIGFSGNQERVGDGAVCDLGARAGQLVPVAACGGLHRTLAHIAVERDRNDLGAADRGYRPLLLQRFGAELGQRARAEHRRFQIRHRGELAAKRDKHRRLFQHPETTAAQRLRRGGRQDVGVDQLAPQVAVEPLLKPVELALMFWRAHRLGDGAHQPAKVFGGLCCLEVHVGPYRFTRGRPSATMPMMSR